MSKKKASRPLPKASKVSDAKAVPNAQREAVLKQIGDGGNDGNIKGKK